MRHHDQIAGHTPRVSIGLPVRNGADYLERQLETLLTQDFHDFELVISDNASSDATETICRAAAARDHRIRYHRVETNRGLAWNWNRTFELSRAPYFKWAAHDDEHDVTFLRRCVEVLEADPTVVCCHSASVDIDEQGTVVRTWPQRTLPASDRPHVRLADILRPFPCLQIFGVMRSSALERTGLHRPFPESDHALLAELVLLGRIVELPEPLFRRRDHAERSVRLHPRQRARWTLYTGRPAPWISMPGVRLSWEIVRAVARSPTRGKERLLCWLALRTWVVRNARRLARDTGTAILTAAGRPDAVPHLAHPRALVRTLRRRPAP
jgi:glycosyltransferase involved in cell wall biosynthesis